MKKRYSKTNTALDYVFIAPSALLLISFLCSLIPAIFCSLNKLYYAYLSLSMLIISIGFHIYTLILWRRYWGLAPLAYALGQPALHFMVIVFGGIVSATLTCERIAELNKPTPFSYDFVDEQLLFLDDLIDITEKIDAKEHAE